MKKLPIGIQDFEQIRKGSYLYVDKTHYLPALLDFGKYLFLSRPRRFGKSLLLGTLKAWFEGKKELFEGLSLYQQTTWQAYPVILIDYSVVDYHKDVATFERSLYYRLENYAIQYEIKITRLGIKSQLEELVRKLYQKTGQQVVLLIDEYDKPIIDFLDRPVQAHQNKEVLANFYSVIKSLDPYLHFVMITGVSRFSKISVFSGMNNLIDITLQKQFGALLGFTQKELETTLTPYLQALQQQEAIDSPTLLNQIQYWYNGYSWNVIEKVYNPFSILNLLHQQQFKNYWFSTGTPTFLIEQMNKAALSPVDLTNITLTDISFDAYDLKHLDIKALLFQTGYLTITHQEKATLGARLYHLQIPNEEVRASLFTYLLADYTQQQKGNIQPDIIHIRQALVKENFEQFKVLLRRFMAGIPSKLHIKKESYYQSLFYMLFSLLGIKIELEKLTDKGIIDGVLELDKQTYIVEFKFQQRGKMISLLTRALEQIRHRKYYEAYLRNNKKIILLAIGFIGKTVDIAHQECT
jgi:hypothetical protein